MKRQPTERMHPSPVGLKTKIKAKSERSAILLHSSFSSSHHRFLTIMETNLIKDEGGLDLHPKKTVICPKKNIETLLNVNSKNFKTKDGKKNLSIRQKALNKLTSKTPLGPEEDLDTESSDDDNECIAKQPLHFLHDEMTPGHDSEDSDDSEDFEISEDFDKEEPASTKTYTSHSAFISALFQRDGREPKMLSDDEIGVQVKSTLFQCDDGEPKMVSDYEIGVQVKSTLYRRDDGGELKRILDYEIALQKKQRKRKARRRE